MKRFEIWVANLPDHLQGHVQCGRRPIIIVSNDEANLYSPVVSVVPLTSKFKKKYQPTHVIIRGYGLKKSSNALCETILTVDNELADRYTVFIKRGCGGIVEQLAPWCARNSAFKTRLEEMEQLIVSAAENLRKLFERELSESYDYYRMYKRSYFHERIDIEKNDYKRGHKAVDLLTDFQEGYCTEKPNEQVAGNFFLTGRGDGVFHIRFADCKSSRGKKHDHQERTDYDDSFSMSHSNLLSPPCLRRTEGWRGKCQPWRRTNADTKHS